MIESIAKTGNMERINEPTKNISDTCFGIGPTPKRIR